MEVNKQLKIVPINKHLSIICKTCLSRDRKLYAVEDLYMKSYCKDLQLSVKDKVCWECRRTMSKFLIFTRKALTARALLAQWIKDTKNNPLPILSNLTTFSPYNLTCTGESKADIKNYIVVKLEPMDANLNIKSENDQYIDQDSSQSKDEEELDIESKITVKTNIDDLKGTVKMPDENPPLEQSQATECAEVYNNRTVLTPPLLKIEPSSWRMINEDALRTRIEPTDGESTDTDEDSRIINLFTLKELTHIEMLLARNKNRVKKNFKTSMFKCKTCIKEFPSQKGLDRHNKKHCAEAGHYVCGVCNQRFGDESLLRFHEKVHTRVYVCPNCAKECLTTMSALRHYEECSTRQLKVHNCNQCEKQFTTLPHYRRHKRQAHGPIAICDLCGKHFTDKCRLVTHLLIHSGNIPTFECSICKKNYRWKGGLASHMRVHNNTKEDGAYCAACDIQFKNVYTYKHHLENTLKHVKKQDLRFPCPHCGKRFDSNSYRKCHIESMHSNEHNHSCNMCDQSFKTRIRLRAHARRAHEGYVQPRNKMCNVCGHTFKEKATLKQHMNSHTGKRPYVCETCGATFSYSAALYTHRKNHKRCRAMLEQKKAKGETNSESNVEQTTN